MTSIDRSSTLSEIKRLHHTILYSKMRMEKAQKEIRAVVWDYVRSSPYSDAYVARVLGVDMKYLADVRNGLRVLSYELIQRLEKL